MHQIQSTLGRRGGTVVAGLLVIAMALGGCRPEAADVARPVPAPIHLLLPRELKFHSFSKTNRVFDGDGKGMEVFVQALDAFGDPTKAFGTFRFEMYSPQPGRPGERGTQVATWEIDVYDPEDNLRHWNSFAPAYKFRLRWAHPVPLGQEFILVAVFSSPHTRRIFAEQEFISGQ